jgi:hypothetical protein
MKKEFNFTTHETFTVKLMLNKSNPWGESICCNSVVLYTTKETLIATHSDLQKLLPIKKYIVVNSDGSEVVKKATKTVKEVEVETITEKEEQDESETTSEEV